ncbi:MAG TPA: type II and III secretion system protein family protein [Phycisphaerae bacterium]|nr:type II and III secretion system protein family protein [Phycisphaerales bacterium]HRX86080.1 type II and III secretion system protein family protein [Phycisphaerae bacterium]
MRRAGNLMVWGAAAWLAALTPAAVYAEDFSVTVREVPKSAQRVTVPLHGSVVVETSEPMSRVQVVESNIAKIEPVSAKQYVVTGTGYGSTQVMLWSESGERQVLSVNVELDVSLLNEKIHEIDPQSTAQASSLHGNIILAGTVSGPEFAERIMRLSALFVPTDAASPEDFVQNHMTVSGEQQVLLRCTVAEVNRSAIKRLGVNGFLAGDNFKDAFAVSQIGGINPINIGAAANTNVTGTIPFLTAQEGVPLLPATSLSLGFPRIQMQLFLDALAQNSLLKVLAEPDLVAVSGETASFLAGGEFPIPVPQSGSSTGAITIEFREFGVRVNFTPVVLAHQKIRLRVAPEVSETDFSTAIQIQGYVVPGLTQRRVETTIEVSNGQTLAVAGLLSEQVRGIANKLPGLGEVPVLGALFRSVEYQRRQTELVVLVTPEIIAPMDPQQVAKLPGEEMATPNDFELYALGLLEGEGTFEPKEELGEPLPTDDAVAPVESEPEQTSFHGPWGFSTASDL